MYLQIEWCRIENMGNNVCNSKNYCQRNQYYFILIKTIEGILFHEGEIGPQTKK